MGVTGKLEVEVDIKCHGDVFHELFGQKPHHIANITPEKIHSCAVHEGDFGKPGSIISWEYTLDGKRCVDKNIVEAIDEENKSVRFKVIEGESLKDYKSLTMSVHVIPRPEYTAVKWLAEFEKIADDGPYPTKNMEFCIHLTRDIEAHHLKQ